MLFKPLKPMLLSNHNVTPFSFHDPNLLYEPKFDGWRLLLHKEGSKIEIYTRHGNIVTQRFPEFIEAATKIPVHSIILDCEGVCFNPINNRPDFALFESRAKLTNSFKIQVAMKRNPVTLIPFDVIMIDGHSLIAEQLLKRKNVLAEIVSNGPGILLPAFVIGNGQELFDWTLFNNWEGICSKSITSRYSLGKRNTNLYESWIKLKHTKTTDEAFIMGYRVSPFALIVGLKGEESNDTPIPAALVEFGFSTEEKIAFRRIAKQLHTFTRKNVQYVDPILKCKVEYLEKTNRGALRICTFRGFIS